MQGAGCGVLSARCRVLGARCGELGVGCRLTIQPLLMEHPGTLLAGAGAVPLPTKRSCEMLSMPDAAEAELVEVWRAADHVSR